MTKSKEIVVDNGYYWLSFISRYRGQSDYQFESRQGKWRLCIPDDEPPFWYIAEEGPFSAAAGAIIVRREEEAEYAEWLARHPDMVQA